jgi:hypothetical protein
MPRASVVPLPGASGPALRIGRTGVRPPRLLRNRRISTPLFEPWWFWQRRPRARGSRTRRPARTPVRGLTTLVRSRRSGTSRFRWPPPSMISGRPRTLVPIRVRRTVRGGRTGRPGPPIVAILPPLVAVRSGRPRLRSQIPGLRPTGTGPLRSTRTGPLRPTSTGPLRPTGTGPLRPTGTRPLRRGTRPLLLRRRSGTRPLRRSRLTARPHPWPVIAGERVLQVRLRILERGPLLVPPLCGPRVGQPLRQGNRPVPGRFLPCARSSRRRWPVGGGIGPGRRLRGGRPHSGASRVRGPRRVVHRGVHGSAPALVAGVPLTGQRLPFPGDLVDPPGFVLPPVRARGGAPAVHRGPGPDGWRRSVTTSPTLSVIRRRLTWRPGTVARLHCGGIWRGD